MATPKNKPAVAPTSNFVLVPDLPAIKLTALVRRKLKLTYVDPEFAEWDYHTDRNGQPIQGRGLAFEALAWTPGKVVSEDEVRSYFRDQGGFYGHSAAFMAWRRTCGLQGSHASIPEDEACWPHPDGSVLPTSHFNHLGRELCLFGLGYNPRGEWSFVGFRVHSQPSAP